MTLKTKLASLKNVALLTAVSIQTAPLLAVTVAYDTTQTYVTTSPNSNEFNNAASNLTFDGGILAANADVTFTGTKTFTRDSTLNPFSSIVTFSTGSISGGFGFDLYGHGDFHLEQDASALSWVWVGNSWLYVGNSTYLPNLSFYDQTGGLVLTGSLILSKYLEITDNVEFNTDYTPADTTYSYDLNLLSPLTTSSNCQLNKSGDGTMVVETNLSQLGSLRLLSGDLKFSNPNNLTDMSFNGGNFCPQGSMTFDKNIILDYDTTFTIPKGKTFILSGKHASYPIDSVPGPLTIAGEGTFVIDADLRALSKLIVSAGTTLKLNRDLTIWDLESNGTINFNGKILTVPSTVTLTNVTDDALLTKLTITTLSADPGSTTTISTSSLYRVDCSSGSVSWTSTLAVNAPLELYIIPESYNDFSAQTLLTLSGTITSSPTSPLTVSGSGLINIASDATALSAIIILPNANLQTSNSAYLPNFILAGGTFYALDNITIDQTITFTDNSYMKIPWDINLTLTGGSVVGNSKTLSLTDEGKLIVLQDISSLGNITLENGYLQVGNVSYLPTHVTLNGGTLMAAADITLNMNFDLTHNSCIDSNNQSVTLSGGSFTGLKKDLTKEGNGTLIIDEDISFLNNLVLMGGTVKFTNGSYLPTLYFYGGILEPATTGLTISSDILASTSDNNDTSIMAVTLNIPSGYTLTIGGGNIAYEYADTYAAGTYTLNVTGEGTLIVNEDLRAFSTVLIDASATLQLGTDLTLCALTNNGTIVLNGHTLTVPTGTTTGTISGGSATTIAVTSLTADPGELTISSPAIYKMLENSDVVWSSNMQLDEYLEILVLKNKTVTLTGNTATTTISSPISVNGSGKVIIDKDVSAASELGIEMNAILEFTNATYLPNEIKMRGGTLQPIPSGATFNHNLTFLKNSTLSTNGGTFTFSGGTVTGAKQLTISGYGIMTLTADLSALSALKITESTILEFGNTSHLPSTIHLSTGILKPTANNLTLSQTLNFLDHSTINTSDKNLTIAAITAIDTNQTLTVTGTGSIILSAATSALASIKLLDTSTLKCGNSTYLPGQLILAGGTIQPTDNLTEINTTISMLNNTTISLANYNMTFANPIYGYDKTLTLTSTGSSQITFNSDASTLSSIVATNSVIKFSDGNYLPNITLSASTLTPTANNLTLDQSITLGSNLTINVGAQTLTLLGGSLNGAYKLTVSGTGTLIIGESVSALTEIIVNSGATLKLSTIDMTVAKITNNGTIALNGKDLYITGTGSTLGTITHTGTEGVILGDNNTNNTETIIADQNMTVPLTLESGDVLQVQSNISLGKITVGRK